jgi:hypothetical protein
MHILLILVLLSSPGDEATAKAIAAELTALGQAKVHVVIGQDASALLEARGLKSSDMVGSPVIANHLTAADPDLAVIRIDRHTDGGDVIIETTVWIGGHKDGHVAIAGHGGDPTSSAIGGIIRALGPRLPSGPEVVSGVEDGKLAQIADKGDWQDLLVSLKDKTNKNPRQFYYLVLAQVRLGLKREAADTVAQMTKAHPKHFLVAAAASLLPSLPPPEAPIPVPTTADKPADGTPAEGTSASPEPKPAPDGNELRDAPTTKDDGGNVLK